RRGPAAGLAANQQQMSGRPRSAAPRRGQFDGNGANWETLHDTLGRHASMWVAANQGSPSHRESGSGLRDQNQAERPLTSIAEKIGVWWAQERLAPMDIRRHAASRLSVK